LLTRIVVGLAFAVVYIAVLFFLPPAYLTVALAFVAAMASYEVLRAVKAAPFRHMYLFTAVAAAAIPVSYYFGIGGIMTQGAAIALMAALFFNAVFRYGTPGEVRYEQILVCLFSGILVPACLATLVQLRVMEHGRFLVMLPVICASLTDVGAYFIGMFFGRHRGVTKVSPNKSVEGFLGGIVFGCFFMMLYAYLLQRFGGLEVSYVRMALYGVVGSAITELGDLSFSLIKRQTGIKDYGKLMPGHGGMMDRFDSTVFSGPAILLLVWLLPAF